MTAKHIIRSNGIDFLNDYIDFRRCDPSACFYGNVPTSQCFIYVWQKSNDFNEFKQNLQSLYDAFVAQHPGIVRDLHLEDDYYKARASRYRRKGVDLKKFSRCPSGGAKDWDSLAKFAENIH